MNQEQVFSAVSQRFPGVDVSTSQAIATGHKHCFIMIERKDGQRASGGGKDWEDDALVMFGHMVRVNIMEATV